MLNKNQKQSEKKGKKNQRIRNYKIIVYKCNNLIIKLIIFNENFYKCILTFVHFTTISNLVSYICSFSFFSFFDRFQLLNQHLNFFPVADLSLYLCFHFHYYQIGP